MIDEICIDQTIAKMLYSSAMKKTVVFTDGVIHFLSGLPDRVVNQFVRIRDILSEEGRLVAPFGEKVSGHTNLFAIRITQRMNVRFFYCYDTGNAIYVIHGYEKKGNKIPHRELEKALTIKKGLGL
jgi:phage-related protein